MSHLQRWMSSKLLTALPSEGGQPTDRPWDTFHRTSPSLRSADWRSMVRAMLAVLLGFLGLILGAAGEETGSLVGALAGAALGVALQASKQTRLALAALTDARLEISRLTRELHTRDAVPVAPAPVAAPDVSKVALGGLEARKSDALESLAAEAIAAESVVTSGHGQWPIIAETDVSRTAASEASADTRVDTPAPVLGSSNVGAPPTIARENPVTLAYQWLFGGNTVVRVGLVVLMVGVVLLLKWAADNELFPIEVRVMFAAAIGISLLVLGYRLRESKPGFGLTLQGGGIAGLYLTTFFAYRFYELIPPSLAFAVLAALALFTCALSALQQAQGLALIGLFGGYMAPILASSGEGSHVGLFAYTALLNAVVLTLVALRRWVNVARLGFLFTFGFLVGWRVLRYEPEQLLTTEPFVVVYFLTYLAVPLLLARGAVSDKLSGLGILFGTPLATLGVQAALLNEEPLYMALSTVGLGLVYVMVARGLIRSTAAQRQLSLAFIAIAAGLATVAIPYALQTQGATGAAWCIEGAGIVWFGLRQKQRWTVVAGAVLQLAGLCLYLASIPATHDEAWIADSLRIWLGAWLQAAALYVTGYLGYRDAKNPLGKVLQVGLVLGCAAFILGPLAPILDQTRGEVQVAAVGVWITLGAVMLDRVALALKYGPARYAALIVFPFTPLFLLACAVDASHAFAGWQGPAWLVVAAGAYYVLRHLVNAHLPRLAWLYAVSIWWVCGILAVELVQLTSTVLGLGNGWVQAALLLPPVALLAMCVRASRSRGAWSWLGLHHVSPEVQRSVPDVLLRLAAVPLVVGLALVLLGQNLFISGDPDPLPYLVLANPLDLMHLGALAGMWAWTKRVRALRPTVTLTEIATGYSYAVFGLAFVWFNALLARTVHQYADVEFSSSALFRSDTFQVTVSVAWAVLSLTLMWWTSRKSWRRVWFVGAALLGATIVKLFLVDLSRLGTGPKILTFLAVGLLVLLIGYLSPVPPSQRDEADDDGSVDDRAAKTKNPDSKP